MKIAFSFLLTSLVVSEANAVAALFVQLYNAISSIAVPRLKQQLNATCPNVKKALGVENDDCACTLIDSFWFKYGRLSCTFRKPCVPPNNMPCATNAGALVDFDVYLFRATDRITPSVSFYFPVVGAVEDIRVGIDFYGKTLTLGTSCSAFMNSYACYSCTICESGRAFKYNPPVEQHMQGVSSHTNKRDPVIFGTITNGVLE